MENTIARINISSCHLTPPWHRIPPLSSIFLEHQTKMKNLFQGPVDLFNLFCPSLIPTEDSKWFSVPAVIFRVLQITASISVTSLWHFWATFHAWEETFTQPGHSSPSTPSFRPGPDRPIWKTSEQSQCSWAHHHHPLIMSSHGGKALA